MLDGAEHIVMMLVARKNVSVVASTFYGQRQEAGGHHTVTDPCDYIFLGECTGPHSAFTVMVVPPNPDGTATCSFSSSADGGHLS